MDPTHEITIVMLALLISIAICLIAFKSLRKIYAIISIMITLAIHACNLALGYYFIPIVMLALSIKKLVSSSESGGGSSSVVERVKEVFTVPKYMGKGD